jgi:hypothetical protein
MLLREMFSHVNTILREGGNLRLGDPDKGEQVHDADEIDLKVHNRTHMVGLFNKLLHDINNAFNAQFSTPLWSPELLKSQQFLGGSSLHFFNTTGISDEQFMKHKPKVGDIDTQCNKELEAQVHQFLSSHINKPLGDTTFLGFSAGNEQYNALFQYQDPPIKVQIDFEFGKYDATTNTPDEWFRFSHNSEWNDIEQGVKGVFHKYLYRSLSGVTSVNAYTAEMKGRGKARAIQISDTPEVVNRISFAVASKQGGGVSEKYKPYIDPETNQPMIKNGLPVLEPVAPGDRTYVQSLSQQFNMFFGQNPTPEDSKLQQSFLGTLDLINKYIDNDKKSGIVNDFLAICFEPGSQMITRDDPKRDAEIKFIAVDLMLQKFGLNKMRTEAVRMAKEYEDEYTEVEEYKKAHPEERQPRAALKKAKALQQLKEAEETAVKAQLRKGMPHLHDLKAPDFLDLLDELHDGNGRFKLQNIPLNVKVDGFGGRFGKNAEGKPFMGTSRTEPRYAPGFVAHHQKKGTTDPEILDRAKMFDDLFIEMMNAVELVDNKLGSDFLVNKQVTCEVLFLPFATETDEGRLKFVGIHYDKLPQGVQLALVPFHIVQADTGEPMPDADKYINALLSVGQQGSVMFINNRLTQNKALDVTEIINPLDNIEALKQIVSDTAGKRDRASQQLKKDVEEKLQPIKIALEKAIIEDPNIIGKDMLGKDYEGIVINSRLGPIKVTSTEQRAVISAKNAAKVAARTEQPRGESKTAVVAIGSFVGHKGHQELWNYTVNKAKELGGDPYLFIGNAEGKDDPIPPSIKVQTWHKLYPHWASHMSTVIAGGTLIQKIKHELINPLPGKPPRYDNIIIMVGEDRANMNIAQALMKAVNKFAGYEHVKVHLEVTPRGQGVSGTALRKMAVFAAQGHKEQAMEFWRDAFNSGSFGAKPLPDSWIKHLMQVTQQGMGIAPGTSVNVVDKRDPNPQEELADESLMGFLGKVEKPAKKKPVASAEEMRKYFEKEKNKEPEHIERGEGNKKVKQVYTRSEFEESVKYANKVVREMRAQEFVRKQLAEGDVPYAGKGAEELHDVHIQALRNAMSIPNISMNKANGSPYMQYRFGIAMANPDMPRAGAMSGDPLITAYTDAELQKVKDAAKSMGAGAITYITDSESNELEDGNKVSIVPKQKKNKYGI